MSDTQSIFLTDLDEHHLSHSTPCLPLFPCQSSPHHTPSHQAKKSRQVSLFTNMVTDIGDNESSCDMEHLFRKQVAKQREDTEEKAKRIKKRLVAGNGVKLRKNLKRKVKPAVEDPALIPMPVYFLIISYDSGLFRKFLNLSRPLRKHLLFHLFSTFSAPIRHSFADAYSKYFEIEAIYVECMP